MLLHFSLNARPESSSVPPRHYQRWKRQAPGEQQKELKSLYFMADDEKQKFATA